MKISPIMPIEAAWNRMVQVLFKPFDIGKWFALGFCAFLAQCGQAGGHGAGIPNQSNGNAGDFNDDKVKLWIEQNLELVIGIGIALALVIIGISLLAIWLNSRGKFMLIDGIVKNRGAVVEPWREYRAEGNSLFKFKVVISLLALFIFVILAGIPTLIAIPDMRAETFGSAAIVAIVLGSLFLIVFILASAAIQFFIGCFVTPTMYLRRVGAMKASSIAWNTLVRNHLSSSVLFGLMLLLLGIGASTVALLATCLTCCMAALPYIGTVILLPIPVFFTAYALKYLEQFGSEWTFFPADGECDSPGHQPTEELNGSA